MTNRSNYWLILVLITLAATGGVHALSTLPFFQLLSLKAYDAQFALRGKRPVEEVILIVADQKALDSFPELQAFWHPYYAEAIRGAEAGGARVVGMDLAFGIPVEKWAPGYDRMLAEAVASARIPVVVGFVPALAGKQQEWPIPVNMISSAMGNSAYANMTVDSDEFVRRQELIEAPAEAAAPHVAPARSLALKIAERALGMEAEFEGGRLVLGKKAIPISAQRGIAINYAGPPGTFPRISLADFVAASRTGRTDQLKKWVQGKIVLIGSDSFDDRFPTPFYTLFEGPKWTTAGVEIHANTVRTLLTGDYILPVPQWIQIGVLTLVASLTFVVVTTLRNNFGFVAASSVMILGVALAGSHAIFLARHVLSASDLAGCWLLSLILSIAYRFVFAERRSDHFRRALTIFLGKKVSSSLEKSNVIGLSSNRELATILFTDIRGFTAFCEDKDPSVVVELLNSYMNQMVSIIVEHNGQVNKFIGDGILAIFSDDDEGSTADHPFRAVQCATKIVTAPNQFRTGVGIHTGLVVVGNVGSKDKMEYTVLGDTVNLASRLESLNKEKKTSVLMSGSTCAFIDERIGLTPLGNVPVRGQTEPIAIYTVSSLLAEHSEEQHS